MHFDRDFAFGARWVWAKKSSKQTQAESAGSLRTAASGISEMGEIDCLHYKWSTRRKIGS
jgi:hypothetical protein